MDWKIELVAIPVTDVDRAKAFYVDQVGFNADHDYQVTETLRFVQLTPPGSACSIVMGTGITDMPPGSQRGVQMVVADVAAAREQLDQPRGRGERDRRPAVGFVRDLQRPGRQHLVTAAAPRMVRAATPRARKALDPTAPAASWGRRWRCRTPPSGASSPSSASPRRSRPPRPCGRTDRWSPVGAGRRQGRPSR